MASPQNCFVIMPYREDFNWRYNNLIKPAIFQAGMIHSRADEHQGRGVIIRTIWERIQNSKMCIADLSLPNGNVYYEAGFADATRTPLITIYEEDVELLFDLNGITSIEYSKEIDTDEHVLNECIEKISQTLRYAALNPVNFMPAVNNPKLEPEIVEKIISLYFSTSLMILSDLVDDILREKAEGQTHTILGVQARFSDAIHAGRKHINNLTVKITGHYSDKSRANIGDTTELSNFLRAGILSDIDASSQNMFDLLMSDQPPLEKRSQILNAIKQIQQGQIDRIKNTTTDMKLSDRRARNHAYFNDLVH